MKFDRDPWVLRACVSSVVTILLLSSCTPGRPPSLIVQVCLENESGVDQFKKTLQAIAHDERMRYVDGSRATERNLKVLGVLEHSDGKLIHVGVEADNGLGLTAGNQSLNTYDVAVGFSRGQDSEAASAFSDRVVARLKRHWALKAVPAGTGAFPDPQCSGESETPPNNSFKPKPLRGSA